MSSTDQSVKGNTNNHEEQDPSSSSSSSGSTVFGAVVNMTNSIVGAGCIGYGGAFAESGGLASLVTIALFAVLTKRSFDMVIELGLHLLEEHQDPDHKTTPATAASSSFEAVGRAAYGTLGQAAVVISKCLFAFGCMVAYFVIIKDNAAPALEHLTGSSIVLPIFLSDPVWLTILLATVLVLPLCLQRELSTLENFSKLKIVAYGAIATIVVVLCVELRHHRDKNDDEPATTEGGDTWVDHWLTVKPGLLPNTGTFVFAFVSQHIVHLIFLSLQPCDRNLVAFSRVSTFAVLGSAVIMLGVGLPAYMTFWDKTSSNLFLLYPPAQATIVNAARLFLSIGMVLTYPMPLFSLRDSLIQLLPVPETPTPFTEQGVSETTTLLESGTKSPANYPQSVIPWWYQVSHRQEEEEEDEEKSQAMQVPTGQPPELIGTLHVGITIILWACSLVLAMSAPSLGVVLNLVGCLSGALLAFLLPGLFWAKLSGWTPVAAILCVVGLFVACLGSYYSLMDAKHGNSGR